MSKIEISHKGQERFAAFNLMYAHPLADYFTIDDEGRKSLSILLLGNLGDNSIHENQAAYNEIFKVVFSCGQYPGCKLKITIASTNADKLAQVFFLTKDGDASLLRELKHFIEDEEKKYAYLDFKQASIEGGQLDLSKIDFFQSNFDYAIIHTGFAEADQQAAKLIKKNLPNAAVWTYQEFANIDNPKDCEVYRIARNISFSYEMAYNESICKDIFWRRFNDEFDADYFNKDFISAGKNYGADSSIACAAHIPFKRRLCKEYAKEHPQEYESQDDLHVLIDAIDKRNALFNKLISLEHHRWNAYMLTRGYHFPTEDELERIFTVQEYSITDETVQECNISYEIKQKNIYELWHICLCDCTEQGIILKNRDNYYWRRQFDNPDSELSELDRASILYYKKACEKASLTRINDYLSHPLLQGAEYSELKKSIIKMLHNEGSDSVLQYERLVDEVFPNGEPEELKQHLCPCKERNRRRDFYDTDAELISMLPFCIWYGKDYRMVITVTNGNAVDDIKVPTILCAEKAVFVIPKGIFPDKRTQGKYEKHITDFFNNRGGNTVLDFVGSDIRSDNYQQLSCLLIDIIDNNRQVEEEKVVLNCPENSHGFAETMASMSIQMRMDKQICMPILQYDRKKGLKLIFGNKFFPALINKNLNVKEFMQLNNRKILDVGDNYFNNRQAWVLEEAMDDFRSWNNFCQTFFKDPNCWYNWYNQNQDGTTCERDEIMTFHWFALERCGIRKFIDKLTEYRVVRCLEDWKAEKTGSSIHLKIFNEYIYKNLDKYTIDHFDPEGFPCSALTMYFIKNEGKIKLRLGSRRLGTEKIIYTGNKEKEVKFLCDLAKAGLIWSREENGEVCGFSFKDMKGWRFITKEGNAFETYVYFKMRNTGLFKNIEMGVHSSLDSYTGFEEEVKAVVDESEEFGIASLQNAIGIVNNERVEILEQHMDAREIDIVAMYKMTPVFVSCKSRKWKQNAALEASVNEIANLANQLNGIGILCVQEIPPNYKQHDIPVTILGMETIKNKNKFKQVLEQALSGN